jgi:hypothetical protein
MDRRENVMAGILLRAASAPLEHVREGSARAAGLCRSDRLSRFHPSVHRTHTGGPASRGRVSGRACCVAAW